jgi:two-component system, NtrC family, response regulator AtoC
MSDDEQVLVSLDEVRRKHLLAVLDSCRWNRVRTAEILGVNRKTVYRLMQKYGLDKIAPRSRRATTGSP